MLLSLKKKRGRRQKKRDRESKTWRDRNVIDNKKIAIRLCQSKAYQKASSSNFHYQAKYQKSLLDFMLFKKIMFSCM